MQLPDWIWFFFQDEIEIKPEALEKAKKNPDAPKLLRALHNSLSKLEDWQPEALEQTLKATVEAEGVKLGAIMMPTRAAISGQLKGPGVYDIMQVLGKEMTLARLAKAATTLSNAQ